MNLYLLRHAEAIDHAKKDADRYLTDKGVSQAKTVARFCRDFGIVPDVILTSPYRRAEETADIVARKLGVKLVTAPFLISGMQPEDAFREWDGYSSLASVMLVGHEPDFSQLTAELIGLPEGSRIQLRKASLTHLEFEQPSPGSATLHFVLPVKFMGCK
jgi:phosphohistidine phosphatase